MSGDYMSAPCDNCLFLRAGGIRLTRARIREIAGMMLSSEGGEFPCHKTTVPDDDGERIATRDSKHCGGALIFAEKHGNSTQMMRIAERLGLYCPEQVKAKAKAQVFDSLEEMLATAVDAKPRGKKGKGKKAVEFEPEDTGEPCSVVDARCEAPAGYMAGGSVVEGEEHAEFTCDECGHPVCGACSSPRRKGRVCNNCKETS